MRVDFAEALTEHGGRTLGVAAAVTIRVALAIGMGKRARIAAIGLAAAAALFWRFAIKTMEPFDG